MELRRVPPKGRQEALPQIGNKPILMVCRSEKSLEIPAKSLLPFLSTNSFLIFETRIGIV